MGSTTIFYLYWVTSYVHSKVSLVPSILPYLPLSPLLGSVSPIYPVCPNPPRLSQSINVGINKTEGLGNVGQIGLKTLSTPFDNHTKHIYLSLHA